MYNFDGAILIDIFSMSGPPGDEDIDLIAPDAYRHERLGGPERDEARCEGCGKDGVDHKDLRFYVSYKITDEGADEFEPLIEYCQECMEDLKASYDKDPMLLSSHGKIPGAPWWKPILISGQRNNVWRTF